MVLMVVSVEGHGSLVIPQSRNSIDRLLPQWAGGYPAQPDFPGTGRWGLPNQTCATVPWSCQEACVCSNGTSPCDVGQSCFWFSSGCTIGCETCDGNGRRNGKSCRCEKCANATLNDPKLRTGNRKAVAGSPQDVFKYNPWRAPGLAPTFDPCGMAGGGPVAGVESGEYNATKFAKQGDLGSKVLPETPTGTLWKAGGLEVTGWYIRANHGGGYQFRLCPKSEPLTEDCFRKIPLPFEGHQRLVWNDGTSEEINGTYVSEGTIPAGSMWAMNPLPENPTALFHPPCKAGTTPKVRAPMAVGQYGYNPGPCAGNWPTTVYIEDKVRVPVDLTPGEYVLGWRWDCELTAQVWAACADITIVK